MAELKSSRLTNMERAGSSLNLNDFADYVENEVNRMELSGWLGEVGELRKWASELRRKSVGVDPRPPHAFEYRGRRRQ